MARDDDPTVGSPLSRPFLPRFDGAHLELQREIVKTAREARSFLAILRDYDFPVDRFRARARRGQELLRAHRCGSALEELQDLRSLLLGYVVQEVGRPERTHPADDEVLAPVHALASRGNPGRSETLLMTLEFSKGAMAVPPPGASLSPVHVSTRFQDRAGGALLTAGAWRGRAPSAARGGTDASRRPHAESRVRGRSAKFVLAIVIALGLAFLTLGSPPATAQEEPTPTLTVDPASGPAGSQTTASGTGFAASGCVNIFFDSVESLIAAQIPAQEGSFSAVITIPGDAAPGSYKIIAQGLLPGVEFCGGLSDDQATTGFTVVPLGPPPSVGEPLAFAELDINLRDLPTAPLWKPGDPILEAEEFSLPPPIEEMVSQEEVVGGENSVVGVAESVEQSNPLPISTDPLSNPIINFDGISGTGSVPPDTVGDVGPNHYIQAVNVRFAIFDKQGNMFDLNGDGLGDQWNINRLWINAANAGLYDPNDPCVQRNRGDPDVKYDPLADRWLLSQFTGVKNVATFNQCIAISRTGDPVAGGWFLYTYRMQLMIGGALQDIKNDYPKFGVWPDAYYMGTNRGYPNGDAWAFERERMLVGDPAARYVGFPAGAFRLPSDLDGATPPPAGAPNVFVRQVDGAELGGDDRLELREFHVDWVSPAASTFTALPDLLLPTGAQFDRKMCTYALFDICIPQPGTAALLMTITAWPMYRLQYRNFGTHETLVFDHTVDVDGTDRAGIRWYELRKAAGAWSIFQQGTYSPDLTNRWMGSVAMDRAGNMAVGYSVSSGTVFPGIRYAGRLASDPAGQMPQGEFVLVAGGASQTFPCGDFALCPRWGDYSAMSVDPVDDCTFWFTTEYYQTAINWRTRIGSFRFTECLVADVAITSFTASPTPAELLLGQSVTVTLTKTVTNLGPVGPADVDVAVTSASGLAPSPASASTTVVALGVGAVQTVVETFTLTCTTPGVQSVTFTNTIAPILATDPDPTNNVAEITIEIDCVVPVQINIKPGSSPNSVNFRNLQGVVTVAILTTAAGEYGLPMAIDASTIDAMSVLFGPSDTLFDVATPVGASEAHGVGHLEDAFELDEVTMDGDLDLVLHFLLSESGFDASDVMACVKGTIVIGGMAFTFFGCDAVVVRP